MSSTGIGNRRQRDEQTREVTPSHGSLASRSGRTVLLCSSAVATLTWLGHSAFMLGSDRGKRIYVDPFLTGNPKTPEDEKVPDRVDVICVTHGHGDHVGDTVELSRRFPDAPIVCQVELKDWLGGQGANIGEMPGLNKGGSIELDGITYALTNAFHSSSTPDGTYAGEACGIVIKLEDELTVYFAGDTCVFGDMQLIRHLWGPDYAALPIGDHFTMGPREAAIAIDMLGNPRVIPCHWGTFPLLRGTPDQLQEEAESATIVRMEPGDTIELE
jgi:L-ascorbate metabolism protein UlaG (beta-lactamase superfamily)